jgi:murein DD-endopeptidase MepM/ murein hydrolase activator NlpD
VSNNKGSRKEPSFAFKIIFTSIFVFFVFGFFSSFQKNNNAFLISHDRVDGDIFLIPYLSVEEPSELMTFNKNTIYASSPLYFPNNTQTLATQDRENVCERGITSYKVNSGENLSSIASKFEISTETIISANNLKNNKISPEQELIILPVSGVFHMTKSGETISSIAEEYGAKKEDIIFCNNIEETMTGDILVIPGGKKPQRNVVTQKNTGRTAVIPNISSNNNPSWLIPPASGYISQRLHSYNAVDIANKCNTTPIYASASGMIQQTGYHNIAGHYIRVLHPNGIVTFYGHLSKILVKTNQSVNQGDVIAYMGNSGYTIGPTGCHIHFEVRGGTNPFANYPLNHRF